MLKNIVIICIVFVAIFYWAPITAQQIRVETIIEKSQIEIGDQIQLKYLIYKTNVQTLIVPQFDAQLANSIEVLGFPLIDSVVQNQKENIVSVALKITAFDTGTFEIPKQYFLAKSIYQFDTIWSSTTNIKVVGVSIDSSATIRDIKPIKYSPLTFRDFLPFILGFLVVIILVLAILFFYRKQKVDTSGFVPIKQAEAYHIIAFKELDKIKAQKLWQQKQVKEYYTRITYVVRWYIAKQFGIKALEMTTDDILIHLRTLSLDQINYRKLEDLLNLADFVKFAKNEPDPEENISRIEHAYEFVKSTKIELSEEINQSKKSQN